MLCLDAAFKAHLGLTISRRSPARDDASKNGHPAIDLDRIWRHRCLPDNTTRNPPVPDQQRDVTGMPIFPAVRGGRLGSRTRQRRHRHSAAHHRDASGAADRAREDIDWGLVRSFRSQAAEILSSHRNTALSARSGNVRSAGR